MFFKIPKFLFIVMLCSMLGACNDDNRTTSSFNTNKVPSTTEAQWEQSENDDPEGYEEETPPDTNASPEEIPDMGNPFETDQCGTITGQSCADGQYCKYDEGACGINDSVGVCLAIPGENTLCPQHFNWVCGCDGENYANRCHAELAGVSVQSVGRCPGTALPYEPLPEDSESPPVTGMPVPELPIALPPFQANQCGTITGQSCPAGQYCQYDEGACGTNDSVGVCHDIPLPEDAICPQNINPVCGCDNRTYNNACEARASGVSIRSQGTCPGGLPNVGIVE